MERNAPYADTPIAISLSSIVGLKYRTLNCIECGQPFLERNGDDIYRIGKDLPNQGHVNVDGNIEGKCPKCSQAYTVTLSRTVIRTNVYVPLNIQPQTIYMAIEPNKKLRDTYCMECGKAYYSISDRVKMIVDNTPPKEMWDKTKMGPMEARCKFQHCKQHWRVMI